MQKTLIIALVCVNVALLTALAMVNIPRADAQVVGGGTDYLVTTGQMDDDYSVVYTLDLAKRKLLAWRLDKTRKKFIVYRGRDLRTDFGRRSSD